MKSLTDIADTICNRWNLHAVFLVNKVQLSITNKNENEY